MIQIQRLGSGFEDEDGFEDEESATSAHSMSRHSTSGGEIELGSLPSRDVSVSFDATTPSSFNVTNPLVAAAAATATQTEQTKDELEETKGEPDETKELPEDPTDSNLRVSSPDQPEAPTQSENR